ncbi:hypothetical protein [Desulfobacter hydrogenophilus]|nr:hypothetical protein [Desulfobacter hydrogenophilus]
MILKNEQMDLCINYTLNAIFVVRKFRPGKAASKTKKFEVTEAFG